MEKDSIKDLVFSPQSYSLLDIKEMLADVSKQKQLNSVFGRELLESMRSCDCEKEIPQGGLYGINKTSNLVVFWGMPHSGRTSAILSMLTLKGFRFIYPENTQLKNRIEQVSDLFKSQKAVFMPELSKDDVSEIYHATYKSWLLGRAYNISFFKPQNDYQNDHVLNILNSHQEQIHVFCIDCGKNNTTASYLEQQVCYHEGVIKYLEAKGFLKQCNAIYLLVTKSDLMNVPDIYEENAAQTFITSGIPDFWHKIQNVCYDKDIYNVQPVVFSIGNYILKDFARMDSDYGELFLKESILPKCQPNPNMLEKFLSIGKMKHASIPIILVLLLIFSGIIYVWNAIVPPPDQKVEVFYYEKTFMEQEKAIKELAYEDAASIYLSLRKDLSVEQSLLTAQGIKVLPDSVSHRCDSILTNDFSKILTKELEVLFASKKWTNNEYRLKQLDERIIELTSHRTLITTAISNYHDYIYNYLYIIRPLLSKSTSCKSVQEVRSIVSKASQWKKKHPYNKDTQLTKKLSDVRSNACSSCANHYRSIANKRIRNYNQQINKLRQNTDWYMVYSQQNAIKREFQSQNQSLLHQINLLISDLDSARDYRLAATRKSLEQTKAALISVYK